jgi:hypothetical protein
MKLNKQRLMEIAGLLKEATTDRDAIAHFVWGQDRLMDKGEDDIEEIINQMEEEWEASKANYGNVEEYLEELENEGGMEMYMEGKKGATARLNEASSAKETDVDTLKQVIRKANSYDSDAIVAIEDGYYGITDNLPSLIESLQKVVDAMKDDVGGVIPGGSGKLVEAAENELKIYEEIQALLDLSAVGKLL